MWQLDGGHSSLPPAITRNDHQKPHIANTDNRGTRPMAARQTTGRELDITAVMGGGYPQDEGGYPQNICSIRRMGLPSGSRLVRWGGVDSGLASGVGRWVIWCVLGLVGADRREAGVDSGHLVLTCGARFGRTVCEVFRRGVGGSTTGR